MWKCSADSFLEESAASGKGVNRDWQYKFGNDQHS